MYNNYAILKFKIFLDSICIDVFYRLSDEEPEIKGEYFTKKLTDGVETEEFVPGEDGVLIPNIVVNRDMIWGFDYNGSPDNSFFRQYTSIEKELFDEMNLNNKTVKDFDEVDSIYGDLLSWLNDKVNRIQYKPEMNLFVCDFVCFGDNYNKITFKRSYEKDIHDFFKELKNRLMQTYSVTLEKIPTPTYRPNLKWEGSDTDLIELLTSLLENKSLTVKTGKTTRKEVIKQFEQIFDIKLKDAESKLSRATERNENSPFLALLQTAFMKYSNGKLEK